MAGWVDLTDFSLDFPLTTSLKDVRLSWPQIFFFARIINAFRISILTYNFFEGCQVGSTQFFLYLVYSMLSGFSHLLTTLSKDVRFGRHQFFIRISFIQRFSGFHYLLTTCSKDVRLSWPQKLFLYHAYSPIFWISPLTYYLFEGCQAELTSTIISLLSRLVDPRSEFRARFNF